MSTQQFIPREKWMAAIPHEGIRLIKKLPNPFVTEQKYANLVCGVRSATGPFTIKRQLIETSYTLMSRLAIQAEAGTMMFDLSQPDRRELFGIMYLSDQFKSHVSESQSEPRPGTIFYWEDPHMEAELWMKDKEREIELMNCIKGLTDKGLERMGHWFKIQGGNDMVKFSLLKKAGTIEGRKDLCEILFSGDRDLKELIAAAEAKGDPTNKKGLWRNPKTGIYHWNTTSMGLEKEAVIDYLKKDTELQYEMKNLYMGGEAKETPVAEAPVAKSAITINTNEGKKEIVQQTKYTGNASDQQIIDAFIEGESDPGNIGRKLNVHWKTVQKVLKANKLIA